MKTRQYLKDCELLDFDRLEHEEPLDAETKKEGLEDVEEALGGDHHPGFAVDEVAYHFK